MCLSLPLAIPDTKVYPGLQGIRTFLDAHLINQPIIYLDSGHSLADSYIIAFKDNTETVNFIVSLD